MGVGIQVTFDARDPAAQSRFWALALDYVLQPPPEGFASWDELADAAGIPPERRGDLSAVVDPQGHGPRLLFQKVPEGKTAKNRVHLDVNASAGGGGWDAVRERVERVVAAGAEVVSEWHEPHGEWVVLRDPEGNEFCVQ
ncbi:VOC family protein [Thalassiella azotivora]